MTQGEIHMDKGYALQRLKEAREVMGMSNQQYTDWIKVCAELGIPNVKMARELGISETAIRKWRSRHGI